MHTCVNACRRLWFGKKLAQFRRDCEAKSHVEVGRRKCAWGHGATVRTRTASSPKQTSKTPGRPIKDNDTVFVSSLEPRPAESTLVAHLCSSFIFSLFRKEQDRMLSNANSSSYFFCNSLFIKKSHPFFFLATLHRKHCFVPEVKGEGYLFGWLPAWLQRLSGQAPRTPVPIGKWPHWLLACQTQFTLQRKLIMLTGHCEQLLGDYSRLPIRS